MLKLVDDPRFGFVATATHEGFVWKGNGKKGEISQYNNFDILYVIMHTYNEYDVNLMITNIFDDHPIEILFNGLTGKFDELTVIEETINEFMKERYPNIL